MANGGIIVRLIDVVLILLFGFISISEISRRSKIELPVSTQTPPSNPTSKATVIIGISKDGRYLIDNETSYINNINDLRNYILEICNQFENEIQPQIKIRAHWDTPIRHTIILANLCDELDLLKGIDVVRKVE